MWCTKEFSVHLNDFHEEIFRILMSLCHLLIIYCYCSTTFCPNSKILILLSFQGEVCAVPCPSGRYGQDCRQRCKCFNGASCDPTNGTCLCPQGFKGDRCELQCLARTYGVNCNQRCRCQNDGRCSHVDGSCT